MFLFACDVAFWFIVVPELQEDAKLVWVSEGEGEYFECAHGWEWDGVERRGIFGVSNKVKEREEERVVVPLFYANLFE